MSSSVVGAPRSSSEDGRGGGSIPRTEFQFPHSIEDFRMRTMKRIVSIPRKKARFVFTAYYDGYVLYHRRRVQALRVARLEDGTITSIDQIRPYIRRIVCSNQLLRDFGNF